VHEQRDARFPSVAALRADLAEAMGRVPVSMRRGDQTSPGL
jgi:hypothetical protein